MNRKNLSALFIAVIVSVSVYGAAVWVGSQYIETFQNGFLFGNFNILKVSNGVPEYEDASGNVKRLDDMNPNRIKLEDFESDIDSADFLCGTNLTASNETIAPIRGITSVDIDQGATAASAAAICDSQPITLEDKHQGKFVGVCFYTMWDGNDNEMAINIVDNTNTVELVQVPIRASTEPLEHCGYFNTATDTATVDYDVEVLTGNNNTTLRLDDVQLVVDPLTPTDIYASSEWDDCGMVAGDFSAAFGTVTNIFDSCKREGTDLVINVRFDPGTVTGGAAQVTPRFLGNTITVDDSVQVRAPYGESIRDSASVANDSVVLLTAGLSYIEFGPKNSTSAGPLSARPADEICATGAGCHFWARIPIAGWSNTSQGVVVKNRTDSASVENVFSAKIANNGTASITSQNVDFIESVTRSAPGTVDIVFKSGFFTETPSILALENRAAANGSDIDILNPTSNGVTIYSLIYAGPATDMDFDIQVQRQGTDYIKETDKVYTVPVTNLVENVFSAKIANNGSVSLTSENVTGFTGTITRNSAADVTVNFGSGLFSETPSCTATTISGGNAYIADIISLNSTAIRVLTYSHQTPGGVDTDFEIVCQRQGSDYIAPKGVYLGTFGQPTCYVRHVTNGDGGAATALAWTARTLNIIDGNCSFASLASNTVTLEGGAYDVSCSSVFLRTDTAQTRFRNTTDNTTAAVSLSVFPNPSLVQTETTILQGQTSFSGSKDFQLQYYVGNSAATNDLGTPISSGEDNIFAQCAITKVR
jgi:hypothetical protein